MESRKYQLQKQIIEALKANDNDLYLLLKSQWAHRFGVDSLEELNNLDLKDVNQNFTMDDNQEINQSNDSASNHVEEILKEDNDGLNDDQENQFNSEIQEPIESDAVDNQIISENNTLATIDKSKHENKSLISRNEIKIQPKVKALIPLPPKPKYSYLRKWLLKK